MDYNCNEKVVREFFHLFKTPWEYFNANKKYDVVITVNEPPPDRKTRLTVIYGTEFDKNNESQKSPLNNEHVAIFDRFNQVKIPIYRSLVAFDKIRDHCNVVLLTHENEIVGFAEEQEDQIIVRIGYDLFNEVSFLLSVGQPIENAIIPTLERHISLLREIIVRIGILLVEIPPVPSGYRFITCLTHDVDFVAIKNHFMDKTMIGFIYRATVVSFLNVLRNNLSIGNFLKNLKAVLLLPFIYIGVYNDFWNQFETYKKIEGDTPSTYFFIPFKNRSGSKTISQKKEPLRAAKYDLADVKEIIKKLQSDGFEIGLHGIDAWHNRDIAKQEKNHFIETTGDSRIGIRMHWLYFDNNSFRILDEVGFFYDSTIGYNNAVGYRSGTGQVYRPLTANRLMELPLLIQDVTLFSSKRMKLTEKKAFDLCNELLQSQSNHGGVLSILWHQRSVGPEKWYDSFYKGLIKTLKQNNAYFGTASDIVNWFNTRRDIVFKKVEYKGNRLHIKLKNKKRSKPPLVLRIHYLGYQANIGSKIAKRKIINIPLHLQEDIQIDLEKSIH